MMDICHLGLVSNRRYEFGNLSINMDIPIGLGNLLCVMMIDILLNGTVEDEITICQQNNHFSHLITAGGRL